MEEPPYRVAHIRLTSILKLQVFRFVNGYNGVSPMIIIGSNVTVMFNYASFSNLIVHQKQCFLRFIGKMNGESEDSETLIRFP